MAVKVTTDVVNRVLALIDAGLSSREIQARVGVSLGTISKLRQQHRPDAARKRAGRPAKLSDADVRYLRRVVVSGQADNAVKATQLLRERTNISLSAQTTRNTFKRIGLKFVKEDS